MAPPLKLTALNHVSRNCASVEDSLYFYCDILGFVQIKRPGSFDFDGAWLYNYGVGIHLLKNNEMQKGRGLNNVISPKADHISFQCEDVNEIEDSLKLHNIHYITQNVKEEGVMVKQLFFHDPDGHMIEICDCQLIPIIPVSSSSTCCKPCLLRPEAGNISDGVSLADKMSSILFNTSTRKEEFKDLPEMRMIFDNFSQHRPSNNPSNIFQTSFESDLAYCA